MTELSTNDKIVAILLRNNIVHIGNVCSKGNVRIEFGKVGKEGMSGIVQFEKNNPESLLTALEAVEAQTDYKGKS